MKFTYEIGTRVRYRDGLKQKGEVVQIEDQNEVRVLWDDHKEDGPRWAETSEIMPDNPEAEEQMKARTKQVQKEVDAATSALDIAFYHWRKANALQQGYDYSHSENAFEAAYALRANEDLDLSKLEKLVNDNGWSVSSLYC